MKSNKQRKAEIKAQRRKRQAQMEAAKRHDPRDLERDSLDAAPCNPELLAPSNSYDVPPFVERGYYFDTPFTCVGCGKEEIWRATQQKWWYEVAKGGLETRANRCAPCRRIERARRAEARRVHLEGLERKRAARLGNG